MEMLFLLPQELSGLPDFHELYTTRGLYLFKMSPISFWILLIFEFFLIILKTPPCLLLLAVTIPQLYVFQLLCAKTSTFWKTCYFLKTNSVLVHDIFISNYFCFLGEFRALP
jgi:hypothetical protein